MQNLRALPQINKILNYKPFKDYNKGDERATRLIDELRKMYTDKQIESILKQVKEIDDDQLYTYEEVNSTFSKTSTDDEQR